MANMGGFGGPQSQFSNPYAANNYPVTGGSQLAFNPQVGNNRYERDLNLMKNVDMLGGLKSTVSPMEQSLTEHELRHMGRNSLDPGNNNTMNRDEYNPYAQQLGVLGIPPHQNRLPNIRQDATQLDIGRMMRVEREQQMAENEKNAQRFGNFNKILKGTVSGGYSSGGYNGYE